MTRPFRFGVSISDSARPGGMAGAGASAEALGYDVLLVADHLTDALAPDARAHGRG